MKLTRRRVGIFFLVLIIAVAGFFGIRSLIFSKIHSEIDETLRSLESSGLNGNYRSLSFNWRTNVIEMNQLLLRKISTDTACKHPEFLSIEKIRAEGFGLFPLIFSGVLSFDVLHLEELRLAIGQNFQLKRDSSSEAENDFTVSVGRTHIELADFTYTDSLNCNKIAGIKSDLTIDGLTLEFLVNKPFAYDVNSLSFDITELQLPEELYTFKIKQARMDFIQENLRVDSIQVIPDVGKVAFGRKRGFEIDRYDALIPFIEAHNLSFSGRDSAKVKAGLLELQFYLKVFRDKRQPFVKKRKLLPVAQLRDLPFMLLIDSLKVRKSYVQYEEFAEDASEPGNVYFDNLYASIYNIDNRSATGNTRLSARANLLGQGEINLFVNFPLEPEKRSRVTGSIVDFPMPEINAMLVPSTNIKVESGKMEELSFGFSFNEVRSNGELELKYEDLKLAILKDGEKKDGDPEKNNLKSFIMNTFIFRTNMDEDVPEDKRTGDIGFVRDNNRSIFNFWVKSLVSGIKSAYNLDKSEAKKSEKDIKNQERVARREAKKAKREEKKKDRG